MDDNSKDGDGAQLGKGKRKYNAKNGAKSKKDQHWDTSIRNFQIERASKYPFIELVLKEGEPLVEHRCMICTRINKKEKRLQVKIDTIEKHMGKVYENQITDGVKKLVTITRRNINIFRMQKYYNFRRKYKQSLLK